MIDLRSDTVTQPTSAMRAAMADAIVGDDVYGEDPTVNALENAVAERLGYEAGLFVTSGTQSNLVALLTHCGRGDEYIAGENAHTYRFEGGGAASLGGIQPQPVPTLDHGGLDLAAVERVVKPDDVHFARTRLVCLENTHGGKASAIDYFAEAKSLCDEHGLAMHLDGARLWNAAVATQAPLDAYSRYCDSISVCLSKGLGAPLGSVLVGERAFIGAARRWRKMLGGGMRQAGIVAAAGLFALDHHIGRLSDDHERAARLSDALRGLGVAAECETNMVFVEGLGADFSAYAAEREITVSRGRWVIHLDIDDDAITRIIDTVATYLG